MGRRRACEGKVRHADVGGAVTHAKRLARAGKGQVNPYRCKHCGGWHVGRGEAGRLHSLNRIFDALGKLERA